MMKNVRSWNAMSSIGVIWISTSCCFDCRILAMAGSPLVAHRLEGELAEPVGLAGADQAEELRELRVAIAPDHDGRRQALVGLDLDPGDLGIELDQAGLGGDLLDRLLGAQA